MRGMSPQDSYLAFVSEDYKDWQAEPSSIRRGFHLAVSAFHLAEHYFRYYQRHSPEFACRYKKGDLKAFREALTKKTPSFKVIEEMAITYKHLYPRASCSIASTGAIEVLSSGKLGIEQDWETPAAMGREIILRHKDGSITHYSSAIEPVVRMWSELVYGPAAI